MNDAVYVKTWNTCATWDLVTSQTHRGTKRCDQEWCHFLNYLQKPAIIQKNPLPFPLFLPAVLSSFLSRHRNSSSRVEAATWTAAPTVWDGGWDMASGGRREEEEVRTGNTLGFCVMLFHRGDRGAQWYIPIEPLYKNLLPFTTIILTAVCAPEPIWLSRKPP